MRRDRSLNINTNTFEVTCLVCISRNAFKAAHHKAVEAKHAAFLAIPPREMFEPWHEGNVPMVCSNDGGVLFRIGDRTCYGHYQNFHCASCGHVESRLTETGMSY
jgi:hypothetical protein